MEPSLSLDGDQLMAIPYLHLYPLSLCFSGRDLSPLKSTGKEIIAKGSVNSQEREKPSTDDSRGRCEGGGTKMP